VIERKILQNASFQLASRLITTGIGFVITILIARHFGPATFGDFSKITSFVALFYLVIDFGLNATFLKNPKSFSSLFYLRLALSFLIFASSNLIAQILPYDPITGIGFSPLVRMGIFVFSFSLFAQSVIFSSSAIFQKNLRYDLFLVSQTVGSVFNLFLIAILLFFAKSLTFVIFAFSLSTFLTAAVSLFFVQERLKGFDSKYSKMIFLGSIPLGLTLLFNLVYFRIDILLLSIVKPNIDVGIYSIAYKFFDFFIAIPLFLSNALYPKMLSTLKEKKDFGSLIKNYLIVYLGFSIVVVIPVWFLSPLFSIISPAFSKASIPFRILILSIPVFFLTSFLQWILVSLNKQKFLMWIYGVSVIINIVLNLALIPKYSYLASAVITGVCELFILIALIAKLKSSKIFSER